MSITVIVLYMFYHSIPSFTGFEIYFLGIVLGIVDSIYATIIPSIVSQLFPVRAPIRSRPSCHVGVCLV
jgi:hypothetical protein